MKKEEKNQKCPKCGTPLTDEEYLKITPYRKQDPDKDVCSVCGKPIKKKKEIAKGTI